MPFEDRAECADIARNRAKSCEIVRNQAKCADIVRNRAKSKKNHPEVKIFRGDRGLNDYVNRGLFQLLTN